MAMLGGECSECCGGWWCYGESCEHVVSSVRVRVSSPPATTDSAIDGGRFLNVTGSSETSEANARQALVQILNNPPTQFEEFHYYYKWAAVSSDWHTLPLHGGPCGECRYFSLNEPSAFGSAFGLPPESLPLDDWELTLRSCRSSCTVSLVQLRCPLALRGDYRMADILPSDERIVVEYQATDARPFGGPGPGWRASISPSVPACIDSVSRWYSPAEGGTFTKTLQQYAFLNNVQGIASAPLASGQTVVLTATGNINLGPVFTGLAQTANGTCPIVQQQLPAFEIQVEVTLK